MFLAGERLVETLGHLSRPPAVALRVGITSAVSRTVAADLLMPVLLLEKCRPSVRMGEFNELLHDLRAQEIDLLIGESEPLAAARAGLEHERVHRPRLVAIAHPSAEPLKNWENLSLLEYRTASAYHWEVDTFLKENDYRPISAGELDDAFFDARSGHPRRVCRICAEQRCEGRAAARKSQSDRRVCPRQRRRSRALPELRGEPACALGGREADRKCERIGGKFPPFLRYETLRCRAWRSATVPHGCDNSPHGAGPKNWYQSRMASQPVARP